MTLGGWATPRWFVVGFPRPATVHTLREPQDGLRFPSARTVAPRPYLPSHFRPAREGQGNHKGCPYGGTTVGGAGVRLLGCGDAPLAPHLWIPAFAGMTLGEWATPQWFVVGLPHPSPCAPPFTLRFPSGRTAPRIRLSPGWRWGRLENWAYEYERSPYRPSHFRPTREGQGNHEGCPYGGERWEPR